MPSDGNWTLWNENYDELLNDFLDSSLQLLRAEMGNIQIMDKDENLKIVAHRGFKKPFLSFFDTVTTNDAASWASALANRKRVIVEDVTNHPVFIGTPSLKVVLEAGVKACQSTPLITRSGVVIGVISTYYSTRFLPKNSDLESFDLIVSKFVDQIEELGANPQNCEIENLQMFFTASNENIMEEADHDSDRSDFGQRAKNISKQELDMEIAELSNDIEFLECQLQAEAGRYSPKSLSSAHEKIANLKQKLEILRQLARGD